MNDLSGWPHGHEKAPTTPFKAIHVGGIEITSRYQKQHELLMMTQVVSGLPDQYRRGVAVLFCDSKRGLSLSVEMRPGWDLAHVTRPLGRLIADRLLELQGYFTSLSVGHSAEFDPEWVTDY